MTPKSGQANRHLIHHHHITKLFYLLNQNKFIIDNEALTSKLYIISITKNLSIIHHILYSKQYNNSHKINSSPLISNHILEQNYHEREQTPSTLLTSQYRFLRLFSSPQTPSLVVQSTLRSSPQVTPLFHKIILLDLPQSFKTEEYLTWSLSTHNITPTVKKMSSAQAQTEIHLNPSTVNRTKPAYLSLVAPR